MIKKLISFALFAIVFYACSSDNSSETTPTDNFDRETLLIHTADNIIIPAFENFSNTLNVLKTNAETFTNSPNSTTLEAARTAWLQAYKAWQHVEMFKIGKAEELGVSDLAFVDFFNIYPLSVAAVENNISTGNYNLSDVSLNTENSTRAEQGFPALDYLFYGIGTNDIAIIEKYTTNTNATNYKQYVLDVVTKMSEITTEIINDWNNGYRDTFVASTGNTRTSSVNQLVNSFVFYYEKGFRANKFGIPAGIFSSTALPEKVEGLYSKVYSKELAIDGLLAIKKLFNGTSFNGNGTGNSLKSYLQELDRENIANSIESQLAIANTQITGLANNFYQQITDNNTLVLNTYNEIQKVVPLLKVDMVSAMNIIIIFVDADGD